MRYQTNSILSCNCGIVCKFQWQSEKYESDRRVVCRLDRCNFKHFIYKKSYDKFVKKSGFNIDTYTTGEGDEEISAEEDSVAEEDSAEEDSAEEDSAEE